MVCFLVYVSAILIWTSTKAKIACFGKISWMSDWYIPLHCLKVIFPSSKKTFTVIKSNSVLPNKKNRVVSVLKYKTIYQTIILHYMHVIVISRFLNCSVKTLHTSMLSATRTEVYDRRNFVLSGHFKRTLVIMTTLFLNFILTAAFVK